MTTRLIWGGKLGQI